MEKIKSRLRTDFALLKEGLSGDAAFFVLVILPAIVLGELVAYGYLWR